MGRERKLLTNSTWKCCHHRASTNSMSPRHHHIGNVTDLLETLPLMVLNQIWLSADLVGDAVYESPNIVKCYCHCHSV